MRLNIKTVKIQVPKGVDETSLNQKIRRWADKKVYGIAWRVCDGFASADFYMDMGLLKTDPKEFDRACVVFNRIVANSAPKPPARLPAVPPYQPQPPKEFGINQEVRVVGTSRQGVVIASFQETDLQWTYVVHMNIAFKSEAHTCLINRAVFHGRFLEKVL